MPTFLLGVEKHVLIHEFSFRPTFLYQGPPVECSQITSFVDFSSTQWLHSDGHPPGFPLTLPIQETVVGVVLSSVVRNSPEWILFQSPILGVRYNGQRQMTSGT